MVVSAHVSPSERKPRAAFVYRRERVEKIAGRTRQPVKPGHHQHVAVGKLAQRVGQLGAVGFRAARRLLEDRLALAARNCFT